MTVNYWMYFDESTRQRTAAELVSFGLEILKSSKLIKELEQLKSLKVQVDSGDNDINKLSEFAFSYLIDCIRISIFFENIAIELMPGYNAMIQPYRVTMQTTNSKDVTNMGIGN